MTLICTILIGKAFNRVLSFTSLQKNDEQENCLKTVNRVNSR